MATSTFSGELKLGMYNNEHVHALQRALNARLKSGLDPDGDFGPLTEAAVGKYQRIARLPVTGVVDQRMWDMLMGPVTVMPPPTVPRLLLTLLLRISR